MALPESVVPASIQMFVIEIGLGTFISIWLIGGLVYFVVAAFAAVGLGVIKILEGLTGSCRPRGAALSEVEFDRMVEEFRQIGFGPERAREMARGLVSRR